MSWLYRRLSFHHARGRGAQLHPEARRIAEPEGKGLCKFDAASASFAGTPAEQARCLLRPVKKQGNLGRRAGKPASAAGGSGRQAGGVSRQELRAFLQEGAIAETDIGGSLDKPLSQGRTTAGAATPARYFVIHDTSTPNCSEPRACAAQNQFPANMNEADWSHNKTFNGHKGAGNPVAHMITNRVGASFTMLELSQPIRAVKFEFCVSADAANKRGLFIHVENVQPRLSDPLPAAAKGRGTTRPRRRPASPARSMSACVDLHRGEQPARRLAYPALHAPLDSAYRDGHDDPQNFSPGTFAKAVETLLGKIKKDP